jgi:hypothetical protein
MPMVKSQLKEPHVTRNSAQEARQNAMLAHAYNILRIQPASGGTP